MRLSSVVLLIFAALTGGRAEEEEAEEKVWPACDSAAADKTSSNPICDPCSPQVYTEYNNEINTQVYEKPTSRLNNYNVKGWTRFMMGSGRMLTSCPLMYSCGGIYPIWLNSEHPEADDGIVDGEVCAHFTNGNCCTYKRAIKMKNCGNYMVYLMTYNSPVSSSYNGAYCVEPAEQPDVCNDSRFALKEDTWARGELQTSTSNSHDPIQTDNTNNWFTFKAGKGTMKSTCPGLHHCGWRYPMWLSGDYPTEDGQIVMRMGHTATSASNICSITGSQPVYIVKCGDKFYHKYTRIVSYSGFCVNEDIGDLCDNAVELTEEWRGITVDKARDHCDAFGLNDFESWYRIGVFNKKMPDHCVAPNKCGGDNGYYVGGNLGHPSPGEGIVGRTFYYSSATNCQASALNGHILNCGNKDDGDDFIYKWSHPGNCNTDKTFCAEQDPCSSTVYKKLDQEGRAARGASSDSINDYTLEHGWYRFPDGEGIMAKSMVLPGHSGVTYPGWYDGEYPLEEDEEKTGRACFSYNGNPCYQTRPVTVRNCKNFFVYHLQQTASNYGYTYEQDVCKLETMKLDQEWRLQYNVDAIAISDSTLKAGWYEVTIGERQLASDKTLFKHGGSSKYPGWIEGEHPTEEEGIVERTVFFTTSDTNNKGANTKVYIRNCGTKYIYYLRPYSNNYFYAIADELCKKGSYTEVDQDNRLYSNPSELNNAWNNDNRFFVTYTNWYRFMNGNGRAAEYPKITSNYRGGFVYPYQFQDGAHATVPNAGDMSEEFILEHYRGAGNGQRGSSDRYIGWTWKATIKNCGGYFLYKIPPLSSSYTRSGLVVDDDDESVCEADRYTETDDKLRLVSSVATGTGTSDYYLAEGWYRLTAGLGYMPTSTFVGTQCSSTYHGHLQFSHPEQADGIVENNVRFMSTSTSVNSNKRIWVKACEGFYVYRLTGSPGTSHRYCEATPGCKHARELEDLWRVNSRKLMTGRYESSTFGNDGWVYLSQGLKRLPESPPPKSVGGCTYNGWIESHPKQEEGAVPRVMRFPGVDKEQLIEVENCGDKYVYFLTKSIQNDYCYVADTDVCSEDVYREVNDERRLHYSHKYGTSFTRFNLDNQFNGWIRYTIGEGRMMEEPPALTNMCTAEFQGWIDGTHPGENDGVVSRKVCWKYGSNDCHSSNEISIKNCGGYYVYGIAKPPPNNQYGHCIEQDKTEVCEAATKLNNPKRGMLTPTTEYIHDQLKITQDGYYRFMSGLGRLTAFQVKDDNCGGKYKMLISDVLEKDEKSGDALFALRAFTTGFTGTTYRNVGLKCDGYWVYRLFHINTNQLSYCVEEDVCESNEIKWIYSTKYLQWLGQRTTADNEWHVLSPGWYEVKVGNKRLAYSPSDLYDCSATYPGYINSPEPKIEDGIVPGRICYRTSNTADQSSCQVISMKKCATKELYYLTKSPNANYAICVETDVCSMVEGTPLEDTWRLSGTPKAAGGRDVFAIGWYRVTIGNERLAQTREEAKCGANYQGWMTLGRHPAASEGTVNTQICYDTGNGQPSNCKKAQVVNCGGHYLYHLQPATTHYGVCVESSDDSMCTNYNELAEEWRSTEYSATVDKSDHAMPSGWYRFTTGLGRMATHCPDYQHGGGYYPSYAYNLPELPAPDQGVQAFTIMWRHSSSCTWTSSTGYVRNCGDYPVYWLPQRTNGHTTYNVEADSCDASEYEVIEDERRLAWKPATDKQSDHTLPSGWYRFNNGLKKINEECTPQGYGGAEYPGWMEGGHPDVGETVSRTVYFRYSTNCKQTSKTIKVKNCGSFYIYKLVPTAGSRGYTVASEPCDSDARVFDQEDRSIYGRSTSMTNDNGLAEGWYQFTTGTGVMPKSAPMPKSCRTDYPTWLNGQDPSPGEGVVTRTLCAVNGGNECQWQREIKVRNCGNNKMLYYLYASPPYSASRYCVEDTMANVCNSAKPLNDAWRGSKQPGTGRADRNLAEGWYKFNTHSKRMANFPVRKNFCGADYPIYMEGDHAEKGSCKQQILRQVYADNNWTWRSGTIYECHCMNDDYIYYHVPNVSPLTSYNGAYCVEEEPCNNFERMTGDTRSPWYNQNIGNNDHTGGPKWVKIDTGLGVMPTFVPEEVSCGNRYAGWYEGEMPTEVGQTVRTGRYCFVTSASAKCSSPRAAQVKKCQGGFFVYHLLPTANGNYGYCADSDVCDVASEEWGREENNRLQYTSTGGYYSSTRKSDNGLGNKWIRITTGLGRMPNTCPGYMSCGTLYPGWMEGEHPTPAERVVDRKVCFVTNSKDACCGASKEIKVVSCQRNGKQFYLYKLYSTSSNYGYCIDQAPDDVCKLPDSQIKYVTDKRHGTGHYYDSSFPADYQQYTIPSWMEVTILQRKFIHKPPPQYFCGGIYAGWIEDPEPGPNEGVVDSRACYRDSMSNEQCYQPMPLKMKNCNGKMRYLYAPPGAARRNMCVEEDICSAANHEVFDGEDWRLAFTKTEGTYKRDYQKMGTQAYQWFRFTGAGHNKITEIQQEYLSCGTQYPGWLNGEHPTVEDGVVLRTISFTTAVSTYTGQNANVYIKNCGGFMVYSFNFNWWNTNWALCLDTDVCQASVQELDQDHRLVNAWGKISQSDDRSLARGWYRFTNGFEKMPETCPIANSCGSLKPGYLSQPHPELGEGIVERKVCFGDADQCCSSSRDVLVKNCGTHFVYRLYPTTTYEKYCVEESSTNMCNDNSYTELDDDWRGETVAYDNNNRHDDTQLTPGNWYRFTNYLGRMPEYSMSIYSCGHYYPGYLTTAHPSRNDGIQNRVICWSTNMVNEGQACRNARVRNCGSYYLYQMERPASWQYGFCVAQDQCKDARDLDDRWRLIVNPFVSGQSGAADQNTKKGWYRLDIGHGTMPQYEPDTNYGGAAYPSWMLGDLPEPEDGEAERIAKFAGTSHQIKIRVKNCGEYYVYWLQPTPNANYVWSIDTDVCLHAYPLAEEWRNMFYVSETEDDLHTDYKKGKDWYRFTTGFQMMAESPPGPQFSCGTKHPAYLNQAHPDVEDGVVPREVCIKEDEENDIYQACFQVENIRVKNCGDYYTYQLNPQVQDMAYCVYNRKTSCEPKVVHAKYGELAVVNCTLNSEKDFDSSEVEWTKLNSVTLPDDSLSNIEISDDRLLLNINDIADQNAGVYALYIPSTATSELVEVILYSAVEAGQKYYIVEEGGDVTIETTINVVPAPAADKISWVKVPNKKLTGDKYEVSADKSSLTISGVTAKEAGTYRVSVEFEVDGKTYNKHTDVIVQLEEEEEEAASD